MGLRLGGLERFQMTYYSTTKVLLDGKGEESDRVQSSEVKKFVGGMFPPYTNSPY